MTNFTGNGVKLALLAWNLKQEDPTQYMLLQRLPLLLACGMSPTEQECLVSGLNSSADLIVFPPEFTPPTINTPEANILTPVSTRR